MTPREIAGIVFRGAAPTSGGGRTACVPKGNHVARLYQIIHIGTNEFEYRGETKKSDKLRLSFELCNEKKAFKEGEEARPFSVSREFGFSMGPKSHLRPFVEGMIGTALFDEEAYNFDFDDLLGRECLLNVVHEEKNGNVYANIKGATPLPKGMTAPDIFNDTQMIDVNTSPAEVIEALPEFIKNKMYSSEEWIGRMRHEENMRGGDGTGRIERPASLKDRLGVDASSVEEPPF
jgi:hypothetical protein